MFGRKRSRRIDSWDLDSPEGWFSVPRSDGREAGWEHELAGRSSDPGDPADLTARLLLAHRPALDDPLYEASAVWVPDRSTGQIMALLAVALIGDDDEEPFTPDSYADLVESQTIEGEEVVQQTIELVQPPAGPTVRRRELVVVTGGDASDAGDRLVYFVFPPGTTENVELTFISLALDRSEELLEHADVIASSLTVGLA